MKRLILFFILILFTFITTNAQFQFGSDIDGEGINDGSGNSVSFSADGTRVAIGASSNNGNGIRSGHVRVYQETNGNWMKVGRDIDGEASDDLSGYSVSLSANGKILAIGAPKNAGIAGHTRVYEETNGNWIQIGQDIDGDSDDRLGWSVSLSSDGTRVAVGAPFNSLVGTRSGRARIYDYTSGNWVQIGQDILGEAGEDKFGSSIAISANGLRVAIGAWLNDGTGPNSGHVRVFEEINGSWIPYGQEINGESADDESGFSVSLSANGNRLAIGAPNNDVGGINAGHVRIFDGSFGNWSQVGQDIDGTPYDESGFSVSLSSDGTRIAIGEPNGFFYGRTRIFQEVNGSWIQIGSTIFGEQDSDRSGRSVSLSADGKKVAIGAIQNDDNGFGSGHVRVYDLKGSSGTIYLDNNQDCNLDPTEIGLNQVPVIINPGNYSLLTNTNGGWGLDLPAGNYSIIVDTSMIWATTCPFPQTFTVIHPDSLTLAPSIGLISRYPCPAPDVSIHMPFMRPCFTDQVIRVQACNTSQATGAINNPVVVVTLDSLIIPTSFELTNTNLGNNQYQFDLYPLYAGQCTDFWIKATVDCAVTLGQALCMQAELSPIEACMFDSIPNPFPPTVQPCLGEWDESSLIVEGYCTNDTIYFEITNIGVGDMDCYSPVTIYINGVLHLLDSVMLNTQQVAVYSFPGNGESWHLEVEQHPNHPGNSQPKATVENCGGATGQTKINLFAQDDADPVIDIYCGEVTGSYDPNDKTGYPIGLTSDHHIEANQQLQYRIRFQNTGTDTAFTVVIRDTLDTDLDIFSIRSGVASHAYNFRIYDQRVLEWTFNDIMLPDSNINEPLSHGFVFFTVDQLPNLPDGTQINNSAGIYFDFNAPIITNTAQHEVHYPSTTVEAEEISSSTKFTLYPNPNEGQFFIDLKGEYSKATITLTDIAGRVITVQEYQYVAGIPMKIDGGAGIYLVNVRVDDLVTEVFKVVKY